MKLNQNMTLLGTGLLLATSWTAPALADVDVFARILKEKDIFVSERVIKNKNIVIRVFKQNTYEGAAEAMAIVNQNNTNNRVDQADELQSQTAAFGIDRHALTSNSISSNNGIVGVNQDVGNMVNQGNDVAVALTTSRRSMTNSQAETEQINTNNFSRHRERIPRIIQNDGGTALPPLSQIPSNISATIRNSVDGNTGVVGFNQNAGNMNNQTNSLALAVGLGSNLALSEAALGQTNTGNRVEEVETVKRNLIQSSITNNQGIVGVNQSSGNMNNQASVVSMAVLTSHVTHTTPTP